MRDEDFGACLLMLLILVAAIVFVGLLERLPL